MKGSGSPVRREYGRSDLYPPADRNAWARESGAPGSAGRSSGSRLAERARATTPAGAGHRAADRVAGHQNSQKLTQRYGPGRVQAAVRPPGRGDQVVLHRALYGAGKRACADHIGKRASIPVNREQVQRRRDQAQRIGAGERGGVVIAGVRVAGGGLLQIGRRRQRLTNAAGEPGGAGRRLNAQDSASAPPMNPAAL